jgi:hypothetical protein
MIAATVRASEAQRMQASDQISALDGANVWQQMRLPASTVTPSMRRGLTW